LTRRFIGKCKIVDFKDCKDANEFLVKYGSEALRKCIEQAKEPPLENVVTINDCYEELESFYRDGMPSGFKYKGLAIPLSTYSGQLTVITGVPSSGKSEVLDSMNIGLNLEYGFKVCYASIENKPDFLHADKLIRKLYGRKPNLEKNHNELKSSEWLICKEHLENNFFSIDFKDGYDLRKVLAKSAELVRRKGIKVLAIDPFNKVRLKESLKENINRYTENYLNEVKEFLYKYDVIGQLVAHPTKQQKDENGEYRMVGFYDVKGGGELYDMAEHGLAVNRNYSQMTATLKVLKAKFANLGENNAERIFRYNVNNGRYVLDGQSYDNTNWITSIPLQEEIKFELKKKELLDGIPF